MSCCVFFLIQFSCEVGGGDKNSYLSFSLNVYKSIYEYFVVFLRNRKSLIYLGIMKFMISPSLTVC